MEERRLHPRLAFPLQANLVLGDVTHRVTLEDLSAGGAGTRVTDDVSVGSRVDALDFTLPPSSGGEGIPISARATVVHSRPLDQPGGQGGYWLGLQFDELPQDEFKKIQRFIYENLTKGRPQASEMPLDRQRVRLNRPVSVRFDRFDEFVNEVSENISLGGMFIRTKKPQPPGSVFSFGFQLGEDFPLVDGRAEVVWTREKDLGPRRHAGMGVRFLDLDDSSRNVIASLIEQSTTERDAEPPASGRFRVAAVFPKMARTVRKAEPSPEKQTESLAKSSEIDAAGVAENKKVETLRQELARRTRAYEVRVAGLEERIAELTSKHVDEETDLRETKSSASELESLNTVLEQRLEEVTTRLEHERSDLRGQVEEANRKLSELRGELKASKVELESGRRKSGGFENRLLTIEQALRHTEKERDDLAARVKEGAEARRELQTKLDTLESGGGYADYDEIKVGFEESTHRLGVLEDRLSTAERDRDEALGKLTLLSTTETSVRQAEEKAETERQELLAALGDAQNELVRERRDRQGRLIELEEELEKATAAAEDGRSRADELETSLRSVEARLSGAEEEAADERQRRQTAESELRDEVEGATESAKAERRRAEEAEAARQELESELAQLRADFEIASRRSDETESELREELRTAGLMESAKLEDLERSLEAAVHLRLDLEKALTASEEELEIVIEERSGLEEGLREETRRAVDRADELAGKVGELEAALEAAAARQKEAESQAEGLDREGARLEQALSESRSEIDRLEEQVMAVESELRGEAESALVSASELREKVASLEGALAEQETLHLDSSQQSAAREDALRAEMEAHEGELEALRQESRGAEEALREDLERSREEQTAAEQALEVEVARASDLERRIEETSSEAVELRDRIAELEKARDEAATLAAAKGDSEIAALRDEVATMASERDSLQAVVAQSRDDVRGLEERLRRRSDVSPESADGDHGREAIDRRGEGPRWGRAAALVAVGLLLGALVAGPGSRYLPYGGSVRGWLAGSPPTETVAKATSEAAAPRSESTVPGVAGEASEPRSDPDETGGPSASEPLEPDERRGARMGARTGEQQGARPQEEPERVAVGSEESFQYPLAPEVVRAWADAWAAQRVEDYLWFYSADFTPPNEMTRPDWEAYRRERVQAPASIQIELAEMREESIDSDTVSVIFEQAYTAGAYSDRVLKTLVLQREDDSWKIVSEQSELIQ